MALASVSLSFTGLSVLGHFMDEALEAAIEEEHSDGWYVVSVVEYAEILEWRTPHWRVAIQEIVDKTTIDLDEQDVYWNAMIVGGGGMQKEIAVRLANRIVAVIDVLDLIDTGNYRGSIAIGPSIGEALAQSSSQLINPESSVLVK